MAPQAGAKPKQKIHIKQLHVITLYFYGGTCKALPNSVIARLLRSIFI